jgi:hypothetical protein
MGKVYYPEDPANADVNAYPSALAIGDSWFWYPKRNIIEVLTDHPRVSADHANVRILGFNGAELSQYVGTGKYAKEVQRWLSPVWGSGFSEFYISGAGNDAVDYHLAIRKQKVASTDPVDYIDPQGMDSLLRMVSESMGALIHNIRWAYKDDQKTRPIFIHGYDHPIPDGRAFTLAGLDVTGPWLANTMNDYGVPPNLALRYGITKILIDRLNDQVLKPFSTDDNEVYYIDSRGTLTDFTGDYKADWDNELHPTPDGFLKIFEKCWLPVLIDQGIAE